jgi:hypothetical protein
LLWFVPFVITVSEETCLLSQAIPTQRFTVITLPWKCLLQTRYNIFHTLTPYFPNLCFSWHVFLHLNKTLPSVLSLSIYSFLSLLYFF